MQDLNYDFIFYHVRWKMNNNSREKMLPTKEIEITAWAEQNFLFSIIQNMDTGLDWIMNHFIQLRGAHYINYKWQAKDVSVTFYPYAMFNLQPGMLDLCPYINKYMIPRFMISEKYNQYSEFVKYAIDNDFYLCCYLDQFFRHDMRGEYGFHHPNFIYGYDEKKNKVYMMDNFERGKFGKKAIDIDQLDRAYELVSGDIWEVSVFLYKLFPYKHRFSVEYIAEQIFDYLEPGKGICYFNRTVCPEMIHKDEEYYNNIYFGINCYELLRDYLFGIFDESNEYKDKDWRSFSMLCDHKKMMFRRYEYMVKHSYIKKDKQLYCELDNLYDDCTILLNIFLKYVITDNKKYLEKVIKNLERIKQDDIKCMERFLDLLNL